jgi:hypothetical protein
MNVADIVDRLKQHLGDQIKRAIWSAPIRGSRSPRAACTICRFLRETPELLFDYLHCITGVDYLEPDPRKAKKIDWEPHFELLYHLSSMRHRHRIVLRVVLPRWREELKGRFSRKSLRLPTSGGPPTGTNARSTTSAACRSQAIRIFAGFSARKTGRAIPCAKTTRRRKSTTEYE